MKTLSENVSFAGMQGVYSHQSTSCQCEMTFAVYLPPQAKKGPVPVLWYLSGLTCTHENAMTKAGAQAWAAEAGIAVVFPDTSPRGTDVADDAAIDLGQGASFYVDATQKPWAPHFNMWSYIADELPALIFEKFNLLQTAQGITGHSMGGHGALTLAMNRPEQYKSLSAFAPIANPTSAAWGQKQLTEYLGDDRAKWAKHDATLLIEKTGYPGHILIDQGADDQFANLLKPEKLAKAIEKSGQPGSFRMQPGYDHSYFFVASFMEDHIQHHAAILHRD